MKAVLLFVFFTAIGLSNETNDGVCPNPSVKALDGPGGAVRGFQRVSANFLTLLNKNPPYQEVVDLVWGNSSYNTDMLKTTEKFLKSQAPFVALIVLGLLFVLCFPLVGCIFACCRICDNCGGQPLQKKPHDGVCICLSVCLILCFGLLLSGTVFYSLSTAEMSLKSLTDDLNEGIHTLSQLTDFFWDVPNTLTCQMSQFLSEINADVITTSNNFFKQTDQTVNQRIEDIATLLTTAKQDLTVETSSLKTALISVASTATVLSNSVQQSQYPKKQEVETELSVYIALNKTQKDLDDAIQALSSTDVQSIMNTYKRTIDTLLSTATRETQGDINATLQSIWGAINNPIDEANRSLSDVRSSIEDLESTMKAQVSDMNNYLSDHMNGWQRKANFFLLVLCLPVWIALLSILLGLCCGGWGYRRATDPTDRTQLSNCGGNALMCSVCTLFTFGWLLMLVTMAFFTVGYLLNNAICYPLWGDPKMEFLHLASPHIIDTKNNPIFGNNSISDVFSMCKQNKSLVDIFNLPPDFSEKKTRSIVDHQLDYSLSEIENHTRTKLTLIINNYPPSIIDTLRSTITNLKKALSILSDQINKDPTNTKTARNSPSFNNDPTVISQYDNFMGSLKSGRTAVDILNSTVYTLDVQVKNIPSKNQVNSYILGNLTSQLQNLQNQAQNLTTNLIDSLFGMVHCGPFYTTFENVGVIMCKEVGYSIHGLWAGLGWSLLFFIPTVIFCVRLAKYFRRMTIEEAKASAPPPPDYEYLGLRQSRNPDYYNLPTMVAPMRKHDSHF